MAVAYDSVSANQSYLGATSLSWSHTNSGTSNLYLRVVVPVTYFPSGTISDVTYDGASILGNLVGTSVSTIFQGSLKGEAAIYELPNPATGTKTVAVTIGGGGAVYGGGAGSIMYTGVKQTTPCSGTAVTNTGHSQAPTTTVTGTTSGNLVGDCMAHEPGITAQSPDQTGRLDQNGGGGQGGGAEDTAAGGSVTLSWTFINPGEWVTVAAEILIATASANTKRSFGAVIG